MRRYVTPLVIPPMMGTEGIDDTDSVGMLTAPLISLLIIPALALLAKRRSVV